MTTPTHIAVNLGVFLLLMQRNGLNPDYADLSLLVGSNLIDLDHLLTRPVYDPKRNSFKTHVLHRNWKMGLFVSLLMLFIRPLLFLGLGIMLHYFLDYFYNKRERIS